MITRTHQSAFVLLASLFTANVHAASIRYDFSGIIIQDNVDSSRNGSSLSGSFSFDPDFAEYHSLQGVTQQQAYTRGGNAQGGEQTWLQVVLNYAGGTLTNNLPSPMYDDGRVEIADNINLNPGLYDRVSLRATQSGNGGYLDIVWSGWSNLGDFTNGLDFGQMLDLSKIDGQAGSFFFISANGVTDNAQFAINQISVSPVQNVPLPGTLSLASIGLIGLAKILYRHRSKVSS